MARLWLGADSQVDDNDGIDTYIFSEKDLGGEASDRVILVLGFVTTIDTVSITGATIGGVSAEFDEITVSDRVVFALAAHVPTGATGDFEITVSDINAVDGITIHWWQITGGATTSILHDLGGAVETTGDGTLAATIDVPEDGYAFGMTFGDGYFSAATTVWTNLTEDYDAPEFGAIVFSGASLGPFVSAQPGYVVTSNDDGTAPGIFSLKVVAAASTNPVASGEEIEGVGSASASATATGTSAALKEAAGSASASVTATAEGAVAKSAIGSASVQATVAATSAAEKQAAGSASVSSTVAGTSAALKETAGTASATTTATASSRALKEAVGSASASVTAEAVGESEASGDAIGVASVTTTATGVSAAIAEAAGLATVTTSASAIGIGFIPGAERTGGASYLTREEYEAAQARYRKLANARKDIKRRERERWNRILGRVEAQEGAPEPDTAPLAAKEHKPLVIAPIPTVAAPSAKLEAIAAEMQRLRDKIAAHQAALDEEDDIETLLMLVA
jgi:hypothetical protein